MPLIGRINDEDARRPARVDACAWRSPGRTGRCGADRPVHVLRARGRGPLCDQCARGDRSPVDDSTLRSADHVRVSRPPTGRRTRGWRARAAPPLRHRASRPRWPRRKTRGCSSRWRSHLQRRVAMASTVCWTLSPTATGVTTHCRTWWSLADRIVGAVAARLSDPRPVRARADRDRTRLHRWTGGRRGPEGCEQRVGSGRPAEDRHCTTSPHAHDGGPWHRRPLMRIQRGVTRSARHQIRSDGRRRIHSPGRTIRPVSATPDRRCCSQTAPRRRWSHCRRRDWRATSFSYRQ